MQTYTQKITREIRTRALLQQLSNELDSAASERVFLLLSNKLPHTLDLSLISKLNMAVLYGNISTAIQRVSNSKNGNNTLIALNTIAKLLKLNIINATKLSKDTIKCIRTLAIIAMTEISVIDIQGHVLHHSNHHLGQFISDIRHLIVLDPDCEEFLKSAIDMINYYFNVESKSFQLNKFKIGHQLITASSLSQALELITKIKVSYLEKKKDFIENSILAWVEKLNEKWNYHTQDISYSILQICQLMHKNLFSSNKKKILIYLDKLFLDVLNNTEEKNNAFKGLSDRTCGNIVDALSLIEEQHPNYSKYKKMIEEKCKPRQLVISNDSSTFSEASTPKITKIEANTLFDEKSPIILDDLFLGILNHTEEKNNDFKGLSDRTCGNIGGALSLIEEQHPNYSKYKKMIEEKCKPRQLVISNDSSTLSEASTPKITKDEKSPIMSYTEQMSRLTFFGSLGDDPEEHSRLNIFKTITNTSI